MQRYELIENLIEQLGERETIDALTAAMSDDEAEELYSYIVRCYDLQDMTEDDEDEEEEEEEEDDDE